MSQDSYEIKVGDRAMVIHNNEMLLVSVDKIDTNSFVSYKMFSVLTMSEFLPDYGGKRFRIDQIVQAIELQKYKP